MEEGLVVVELVEVGAVVVEIEVVEIEELMERGIEDGGLEFL